MDVEGLDVNGKKANGKGSMLSDERIGIILVSYSSHHHVTLSSSPTTVKIKVQIFTKPSDNYFNTETATIRSSRTLLEAIRE
jgi:hypothetical protein